MVKAIKLALAATMLVAAVPASAATIVYNASGPQVFIPRFDSRLGTLTSVSIDNTYYRSVYFNYGAPGALPTVHAVGYLGYAQIGAAPVDGFYQAMPDRFGTAFINLVSRVVVSMTGDLTSYIAPLSGYDSGLVLYPDVHVTLNDGLYTQFLPGYPGVGTGTYKIAYNYTAFAAFVPEPSTWIMLLTGFAMMGPGLRYRRRHSNVAFA